MNNGLRKLMIVIFVLSLVAVACMLCYAIRSSASDRRLMIVLEGFCYIESALIVSEYQDGYEVTGTRVNIVFQFAAAVYDLGGLHGKSDEYMLACLAVVYGSILNSDIGASAGDDCFDRAAFHMRNYINLSAMSDVNADEKLSELIVKMHERRLDSSLRRLQPACVGPGKEDQVE